MADYKFKKGDRVRYTEGEKTQGNIKTGDIGTVMDNHTIPCVQWDREVCNDGVHMAGTRAVNQSTLELIEPQYKKLLPKVGDKFRVKEGFQWSSGFPNQYFPVGYISKCREKGKLSGFVDGKHDPFSWHIYDEYLTTEYLEPVEEDVVGRLAGKEVIITNQIMQEYVNTAMDMMDSRNGWTAKPLFVGADFAKEEIKQTLKQKAMNFYRKAKMSKEEKTLFKAGYINDDGSPTTRGSEASEFVSFNANQVELVKMAEADIKEAEDAK